MPLTFGYLLDAEAKETIKSLTTEVYNKAAQSSSSASSSATTPSKVKAKHSEITASLSEVSDMFR